MTVTTIPTIAQIRLAILGKIGKGPCELVHLIGECVTAGWDYTHCKIAVSVELKEMCLAGLAECVQEPSPFHKGATYRIWRLPASTPLDASAPRTGAGTVKDGFISASDFKKSGTRGRK